jgi:hypothetical protein
MGRHLAFLLLWVAACGSNGQITRNDNNGDLANLTFKAPNVAAGGFGELGVSYQQKGLFNCRPAPLSDDPYSDCVFAGQRLSIKAIATATCSASDCTATPDDLGVRVVSKSAQTVKVTVTVMMDDGTTQTDSTDMHFFDPDGLAVTCVPGQLCPGSSSVFVGSLFGLVATPMSGTTPLWSDAQQVDVAPLDVVELEIGGFGDPFSWLVHALKPGTAYVILTSGGVVRTVTVHVASTDDIVAGEVHLLSAAVDPVNGSGADVDPIGDLAPQTRHAMVPLVPVWTLNDGTRALGGADLVHAVDTITQVRVSTAPGDTSTPLWFTAGTGPGGSCRPGPIHTQATLGTTLLDDAFTQTCP